MQHNSARNTLVIQYYKIKTAENIRVHKNVSFCRLFFVLLWRFRAISAYIEFLFVIFNFNLLFFYMVIFFKFSLF